MGGTALAPLRRRGFAAVWAAALVSNVGSWLQTVAVGVLVTELTGRAAWTGLVAAAAFLPLGLLSPVGGAVADRVDRRRLLLATTVGELVSAAALVALTATGRATPASVTALVLLGGSMAALGFPAYQAVLPDLVERDELLGAISLSTAQYNLGRVVGPALAGVVLAAGSYPLAFALNALSYAGVVVVLALIRLPAPRSAADGLGLLARIRAGIRGAAEEPGCRTAILTIALAALLLSPFIALIPAVALNRFDAGSSGTSLLVTAQGLGAVAAALALAPAAARFGRRRLLVTNLLVLPSVLVAYAVAPTLQWAALALVAVGAAYIGVLSGLGTVVQLRAPELLRARVLSLYMVALGSVYPLGAVVQGALGDRLGLPVVTAGCALAFVVVVTLAGRARPDLVAALDDPLHAA